jgi:hypothetical protein
VLSVCCLSGGPPGRLGALLALLRPVVDEIVVGLDDRVDLDRFGAVPELCDVLVRYPYAEPVECPRAWLASQCRGDWIFSIDDDEVPSVGLLAALGGLDPELTHALIPRRWLWEDGWLADDPWSPDWQLRLFRADAVSFPGVMHVPIKASGAHAYLGVPLYHLDLVVNTRAQREAKASRYEAVRRGLRLGGLPFNTALYVPELHPASRIEQLPADDAALVEAVRMATVPDEGPRPEARLASREEVDAYWADAPLPDTDYRAHIELGPPPHPVAGELRKIDVLATNLGARAWPAGDGVPEVRLAYRFEGSDRAGIRTPFPHRVEPGGTVRVPLSFEAPAEPGRHALVVDVVHERHRWFGCEASVELTVAPRRRALVLVGQPPGDPEFDARVDEVLAALDPALEPFLVGPKPDWLRDRFSVAAADEPPEWAAEAVVELPAGRRRDRIRLALLARRLRRRARG